MTPLTKLRLQSTRFRRRVLVALLTLLVFLLGGCAQRATFPIYDGIETKLDATRAGGIPDIAPVYGSQLKTASGDYYLVRDDPSGVLRWYDRQVADRALEFVAETDDRGHQLYEVQGGARLVEIALSPAGTGRTFLAIYESAARPPRQEAGSWWRRAWGWLLGKTEQSAADWLFGALMSIAQPIRPVYEAVWLRPVLNLMLSLRWLFGSSYALALLLFALIVAPITDLVRNLLQRILGNRLWSAIACLAIMFLAETVFLSAAIWETLNLLYGTSPGDQAQVQRLVYTFWSPDLRLLATMPPGGWLLGLRLTDPNLILMPLLLALLTFFTSAIAAGASGTLKDMIEKHNLPMPEDWHDAVPVALAAGMAENAPEAQQESWASESIGEGARVAFVPLGVALYFVIAKLLQLTQISLAAWQISAQNRRLDTGKRTFSPSPRLVTFSARGALVLILGYWLVVVDHGSLFTAGRAVQMLHPLPTPAATAIIPPTSSPPAVAPLPPTATPDRRTIEVMVLPTMTPSHVTATVTVSALNLRSDLSTKAQILQSLRRGATLSITGRNQTGDWFRVMVDNREGWVAAAYVKTDGDVSSLQIVR